MAALLAFDTSTEHLAVALVQGDTVRVHEEAGGAQVSSRLIPALRALLARAELPARLLDAIAYGRGPGAFTGLRAACAVAQGYAFGAGSSPAQAAARASSITQAPASSARSTLPQFMRR